jgi:AcrR family transcriptional regulator
VDDQDQRELADDAAKVRAAARELRSEARAATRIARAQAREERARIRDQRDAARERRIAEQVSQDRGQGLAQPPRRARGLSREDIVDAAIAVADAEGTEAVSMRRIARELGVGAMSLYWHVASKEELQRLMLDAVQPAAPELSGAWRADLAAFARMRRQGMLRHPWAIDYLVSGPPVGPNDARNGELLMAALDGLGLDPRTAAWIGMTVATYIAGAVLREIQEMRWHQDVATPLPAMSDEEATRLRVEFQASIGKPEDYPFMTRLIEERIDPDSPLTREERFEFGLDCLLAGIAARFEPRQAGQPGHRA